MRITFQLSTLYYRKPAPRFASTLLDPVDFRRRWGARRSDYRSYGVKSDRFRPVLPRICGVERRSTTEIRGEIGAKVAGERRSLQTRPVIVLQLGAPPAPAWRRCARR